MAWDEIPEINLYSDGGAEPNPGKGGFGVIMSYKGKKKEFSQGYVMTTNNRMELMGVIHGLEKLKTKSIVNVFTDSQYVINGIEKGWALKWKSKNWFRNRTEKAVNADLWEKLLNLIAAHEKVSFSWVKGHAGHIENERCDHLAFAALQSDNLLEDAGYNPKDSDYDDGENSVEGRLAKGPRVEKEGDPCRKCQTAIIKKNTKKKEAKPGQTYYYEFYLYCPGCKTMYLVDEAKKELGSQMGGLF
ncbi:MAG TPA: ribonuclease HI [Flavisolibacter sp.]|nr:ribonuclease HI [Flavisolibacter sp.]